MKRIRSLAIGLGMAGVLVAGAMALNFYGPFNLIHAVTAKQLAGNAEIGQHLDGDIVSVKYIGKYTYRIHTDHKEYILIDAGDYNFARYRIFEYTDEFEYFKNPM